MKIGERTLEISILHSSFSILYSKPCGQLDRPSGPRRLIDALDDLDHVARVLGASAGLPVLDDTVDQVHDVGQDVQAIVALVAGCPQDGLPLGKQPLAAAPGADLVAALEDAEAAAAEDDAATLGAQLEPRPVRLADGLGLQQHEGVVTEVEYGGSVVVHRH